MPLLLIISLILIGIDLLLVLFLIKLCYKPKELCEHCNKEIDKHEDPDTCLDDSESGVCKGCGEHACPIYDPKTGDLIGSECCSASIWLP